MSFKPNVPLEFDGNKPVTFYLVFDTGESKILVGDVYLAARLMTENKPLFVTVLPSNVKRTTDPETKEVKYSEYTTEEFKEVIEKNAEVICINPAAIKYLKS